VTFSPEGRRAADRQIDNIRVGGKVSPLGQVLDWDGTYDRAPELWGHFRVHLVKVRLESGKTVLCFPDESRPPRIEGAKWINHGSGGRTSSR
jgi:hypothetical protein